MPERIDVFISSTSIDLPEYRTAVRDAILNLGLFPSGMEHWPVKGENPVDLCRDMVEQAEVYLGIYAHRYGWRPDGYDGKSITELEYDWAAEVRRNDQPIPRLCFIMADSHPWPKDKMELDALDALNAFKARVKAHQVGFFTTPDNLKAQVIAALAPYAQRLNVRELIPYLRWLHNQSQKSGLLHVLTPRDASALGRQVTVDQVYTPLDTLGIAIHIDSEELERSGIRLGEIRMKAGDGSEVTPLSAMEAADLCPRLVLLGDPGSGKSTFVSFLALCLTGHALDPDAGWLARLEEQGWEQGEKLPVVVTLRDFAQDVPAGADSSARLLFDHIERQLGQWKLEAAFSSIRRALDEGRALVLLDGLDEVPPQKRALVRDTVADFMARCHDDNRYLVTCRILSYANPDWHIPDTVSQTIAPFDKDKISHFIQAWYTALEAQGDIDPVTARARVADLKGSLGQYRLLEVAANPMLLTVMTVVHNHTGALPRESARLYEECVKLLMLRWRPHDARALIEELVVREDDLYRLLWEIAYDAHDKQAEREGAADIPESAVLGIARRRLGEDITKAALFCEYVEKRAGLLIGRGQDAYGLRVFTFPHRTFQEYLAGCHVANERFTRRLPELARRGAGWREALLLAVGQLVFNRGDIVTPLDALDHLCRAGWEAADDSDWQVVWLAGEMLGLIGLANAESDDVGREVLARVRGLLAQLVGEGHLPPVERAAAGRALGVIGDPRPGVGVITQNGVTLPDIAWSDPIPPGVYPIGHESESNNPPRQFELTYSYRLAKYPITYRQFQAFIDDREGFHDPRWWEGLADDEDRRENQSAPGDQAFKYWNHPRERVSWYDAIAFCRWLSWRLGGGYDLDDIGAWAVRLPTEQEWEIAARGKAGWLYPYGNDFDPAKGNTTETGIGQTSTVGLFANGASPFGVLDMSGNTWDWCVTVYDNPAADAAQENLHSDARRVLRGGSWYDSQLDARAVFRFGSPPNFRGNGFGYRVCLPPSL